LNKKVELLSPAGNPTKLHTALAYGADAVYGSVSHFSLRNRASGDFDIQTFEEAIKYTHSLGKKFYITTNGFPFNNQLERAKEHLKLMGSLKPDAFIISTPGMIEMAKEVAPDVPLHLSTQANVLNWMDAKFYHSLGVERIVTAREISLKDIKEMKQKIPELELEIFIHGSMCFSFSGRCLLSALQMGRTPNRGSCANDCRFPYTLYVENENHGTLLRIEEQPDVGTYIFNAKDMNLASHIKEILDADCIDSLKIEGRTKSVYYAGITAKSYRSAIDDYYDNQFDEEKYQKELHTTKHRGFTDAYLLSRPFDRRNTQKHDSAISTGTYEVAGFVDNDENYFMCKYKIYPNEDIEIVLPQNTKIEEIDNEIGKIFKKENTYFINFKKIITQKEKELESVHSGNTNPIKLPSKFPLCSFLRKKIQ
jgi:putative protease